MTVRPIQPEAGAVADLAASRQNWERFGDADPLWAVMARKACKGNRWDPEEFFALGVREIDVLMAQAAELGLPATRDTALDFGCGVGRLTQPLARHFDTVVGIDIAESMLEAARRFNQQGERCVFVHNDRPDLSIFPDDRFDLIYSSLVLQHIPPTSAAHYLREFARVLRPGGLLAFNLTSEPSYSWKARLRRVTPDPVAHLVRTIRRQPYMTMSGWPPADVIQLLTGSGLRVELLQPDHGGGRDWYGFRYLASKR